MVAANLNITNLGSEDVNSHLTTFVPPRGTGGYSREQFVLPHFIINRFGVRDSCWVDLDRAILGFECT